MISREEAAYFQMNLEKIGQTWTNLDESYKMLRNHLKSCQNRKQGIFCTICADLYLDYDKAVDMYKSADSYGR